MQTTATGRVPPPPQAAAAPARPFIAGLHQAIVVRADEGWVEVDADCRFDTLIEATRAHRVMPAAWPRSAGLSVADAVAGVGIGPSAFRHGLVHDTVLAIDMPLADGRRVHCTPHNAHAVLFRGFAKSQCGPAQATRWRLRTAPFARYVRVEHRPHATAESLLADLATQCTGDADFIDAVAYGPGAMVLSVARLVERAPWLGNRSRRPDAAQTLREPWIDYQETHDHLGCWPSAPPRSGGPGALRMPALQRWLEPLSRWCGRDHAVWQQASVPLAEAAAYLVALQAHIAPHGVWICPALGSPPASPWPASPRGGQGLQVHFGFTAMARTSAPEGLLP